jgi:hypothetical protein
MFLPSSILHPQSSFFPVPPTPPPAIFAIFRFHPVDDMAFANKIKKSFWCRRDITPFFVLC